MLKQELSQQEINNVFQSLPRAATAQPAPKAFDFRFHDQLSPSQLSLLRELNEGFLQRFTTHLSMLLKSHVSGNIVSIEQLPYAEFVQGLSSSACLVYYDLQPYDTQAVMEINPALIAPILDLMLGGDGRIEVDLNRGITQIERSMFEEFVHVAAQQLNETWQSIAPVTFAVDSVESRPRVDARIHVDEAAVAIAMEIHVAQHVGMLTLALPALALKALRSQFDRFSNERSRSPEIRGAIQRKLAAELKLLVDMELRGGRIRLGDILDLKPGDIIDLGIPLGTRVDVVINGIPKFSGEPGESGSRSVLISESPYPAERSPQSGVSAPIA